MSTEIHLPGSAPRTLWKNQQGLCPVCHQKSTTLTGWHSHHVAWRSKGGSDGVENRQLLHPTCHIHLHHGPIGASPCPAGDIREP
jgi:RNA-directed DNA polymerase